MRAPHRLRVPRAASADWAVLSAPLAPASPLDTTAWSQLPEPARRWLTHAVPSGAPAWSTAEVLMHGQIRLGGKWRRFTARQVIAPGRGFVWAARSSILGLPVTGFDRYRPGNGQMRWRLLGLVPVMSTAGPDITHSAAGRLAGEGIIVPTACAHATWSHGPDADTAVMSWVLDGVQEDTMVRIDPTGRLREAVLQRWGNPDGVPFGRYPFGVAVEEEGAFCGVQIPAVLRAGWWWGTDRQEEGEFFRAHIDEVTFR